MLKLMGKVKLIDIGKKSINILCSNILLILSNDLPILAVHAAPSLIWLCALSNVYAIHFISNFEFNLLKYKYLHFRSNSLINL